VDGVCGLGDLVAGLGCGWHCGLERGVLRKRDDDRVRSAR